MFCQKLAVFGLFQKKQSFRGEIGVNSPNEIVTKQELGDGKRW